MTDVKGKWALITGASRGIGEQVALFMAKAGCNLILHSRETKHTDKILGEAKALGVEAVQVAAELSDLNAVDAMLDEIETELSKFNQNCDPEQLLQNVDSSGRAKQPAAVDILFNNAAVQIAYRTEYFTTPAEDFTKSFVINTTAPAMICYRLLPKMIERGFGRIINTTSGIKNEPQQAGYSASKAALDKFTTDLSAVTDGTDVIISLTDPGWCRTDLGGPNAFHSVESSIPGVVLGAFVNDKKSGRLFHAQDYAGLTLEEALAKVK